MSSLESRPKTSQTGQNVGGGHLIRKINPLPLPPSLPFHSFSLTSDNEVDSVSVVAVTVGQPQLVGVGVCGVSAVDPQGGVVAVLALRLASRLGDKSVVASSGG